MDRNGREVLLRSGMREKLKSDSVKGAHSSLWANNPKRDGYEFYSQEVIEAILMILE